MTMSSSNDASPSSSPAIAGRTNYREWDRVASDLEKSVAAEEEQEKENSSKALGLDGKYARSEAEAHEREKAKKALQVKKKLEEYQQREQQAVQVFRELSQDGSSPVRLARSSLEAGKRVVTLCDTQGTSREDCKIILTQDLSHLESRMAANTTRTPKSYDGDAENAVTTSAQPPSSVFGLIKVFLNNLQDCTVIVRCKIISGTIEMTHCSNVVVRIEHEATVATMQVDMCDNLMVEFVDAPSGKASNMPAMMRHEGSPHHYWGDDSNDRIFHAGVANMKVVLWRDGFVETETTVDYVKDGAEEVGNAAPEEFQFVTSLVNHEFRTEKVVRTNQNARPMTDRELQREKEMREKAVDMAMEKAIRFQEKNPKKEQVSKEKQDEDDTVEDEVFTSMSKSEIDVIVADCEANKARGNEAFSAGEYAQAILLYTLALDKGDELPVTANLNLLFPRHIVLSNRSAAFLKMGEHEKALADASQAQSLDPTYVKAIFRRGLALHAMGRYQEAIPVLAEAQTMEPKNKQIQQALQFAEVRMTQELRKRME